MNQAVVQSDVDRYVIVEYLAEGGMGAIYLGKKVGMGGFEKEVVLKQLLPEFTSQPEFIDLFLREAKLSASLDHANIVHTIDLVAAGGDYFIVMEYVRGGDMRAILRRVKRRGQVLSPAASLFIVREVLNALAYAHNKRDSQGNHLQLIHRDISPSNVMISAAGEVKLADFGIAKVSTHKSVFYRVKGKVGYMSPEQAYADRPIDHRADLYSLGICLYEMLTGERLFVADLLTTPDQIYNQEIPPLEQQRGMPRGIDRLLRRCMAFDPENRFQDAAEFQEAVVRVAYENGLMFTAPDLATQLHEKCGADPSQWNNDEEEEPVVSAAHPGTELLSGPGSGGPELSGVELTSVLTGPSEPERSTPAFDAAAVFRGVADPAPLSLDEGIDEATRQISVPPVAHSPMAFAATRLARRAQEAEVEYPTFDAAADDEETAHALSSDDYWNAEGRSTRNVSSVRAHGAPATLPPSAPPPPRYDHDTPAPRYEQQQTRMLRRGRPPRGRDEDPALRSQYGEIEAPVDEPTLDEAAEKGITVMVASALRNHPFANEDGRFDAARMQSPTEPAARGGRVPPASTLLRAERAPRDPTAEVEASIEEAPRSRHGVLIAAAILLALAVGIVTAIGLSGPDLGDDPSRRPSVVVDAQPLVKPWLAPGSKDQGVATPPRSKRKHSVTVESSPTDATVYVDNVRQCHTSCTVDELLPDRTYLLSVRRANYVSWSTLLRLGQDRRKHVRAYLSEEPDAATVGYLVLRSNPIANVHVDGKAIGRVTSEGRIPLKPGNYEIALANPERQRQLRFKVTIRQGQTLALERTF